MIQSLDPSNTMKKGPLNFLGRKNQSLFDTNIKMKDMDNVELVLLSSAIPESGTASVRARPTVNHHTSSSDSFQGFAVPTPKVPLLPPINSLKTNGSVSGDRLSNGSVISVPDLMEGEILVPPPPSVAPPPPPAFIPPPDFMGDLNSLDLQPTSEDLSFLKPPPMAPPKPPSTSSTGSTSSLSISSPPLVPQKPTFAPPQPPTERQHKTHKKPPPKPIRTSSVSNSDSPPQTPAPPPPVQTPTLSTFNPQNTAKLYSIPATAVLGGYEDRDTRPKQKLLLEDSGPAGPVLVQTDGKTSKKAAPPKPVLKDVQELKENSQTTQPEPNKEVKTGIQVPAQPEPTEPLQVPLKSPRLQKVNDTPVNPEPSKDKVQELPRHGHKFSPLLDRKLRNLKGSEATGGRDGPAASPLALLMAAKEREKHRSHIHSLSRENSAKNNEPPTTSLPQSASSFTVVPTSNSSSCQTSTEERRQEKPVGSPSRTQTGPEISISPALLRDQKPWTSPSVGRITAPEGPTVSSVAEQRQTVEHRTSTSSRPKDSKEELDLPVLPPPPEFDDFDELVEPPPSICPPATPTKKAAAPPPVSPPSAALVPPPPPKPAPPPPAPKLLPPETEVKPMPPVQTKPKSAPNQLPPALSPSQATLLSILQKKMLEMDHKMSPEKDTESTSDDWGAPLSDEDSKVPVVPKTKPQTKSSPVGNKAATLDMRELESKVLQKYQATSSVKVPASNGKQSKHQYGMTFTVRPGTKQPITPVHKGES
ncbi:uncharacterized protein C6orf132 homolog isoform X1 [Embiotoca jacksoni]|uniref:uncharacterized protein C6orf132 homolog isoform X1 n=2 Tax=Embiotoca jacksoni TaxID=100190 RepID=UPI003704D3F9